MRVAPVRYWCAWVFLSQLLGLAVSGCSFFGERHSPTAVAPIPDLLRQEFSLTADPDMSGKYQLTMEPEFSKHGLLLLKNCPKKKPKSLVSVNRQIFAGFPDLRLQERRTVKSSETELSFFSATGFLDTHHLKLSSFALRSDASACFYDVSLWTAAADSEAIAFSHHNAIALKLESLLPIALLGVE